MWLSNPRRNRRFNRFFLILKQINLMIYSYILEVETMLLMKYKIQYVDIEEKMSMLDLQSFIQHLQTKNKEMDENQPKDNFGKCLVYLRDLLNFMTLNDSRARN